MTTKKRQHKQQSKGQREAVLGCWGLTAHSDTAVAAPSHAEAGASSMELDPVCGEHSVEHLRNARKLQHITHNA